MSAVPAYVEKIAWAMRCKHRLPPSMEWKDVLQAGYLGYLDAHSRYNPSEGATLETYASHRAHGAILDAYRKGRGYRSTTSVKPSFMPIEEISCMMDGGLTLEEEAERSQEDGILLEALSRLPSRECWVLTEHFWEGRTLADIGASLGVSESRVCQIAKEAIATLELIYYQRDKPSELRFENLEWGVDWLVL